MIDTHLHIQPIRQLEATLLREYLKAHKTLSMRELITLRYGLSLARLRVLDGVAGPVDLFDYVAPFRHWLIEQLGFFVAEKRVTDWRGVRKVISSLAERIGDVRRHILQREGHQLDEHTLEREITQRALVLVLGGGGGAGYAHLGALAVIAEMGLEPKLIVGASMGSMMGVYRSTSIEYDPISVALAMPQPSNFGDVFAPYRGWSRFGFPGVLNLDMRTFGTAVFHDIMGKGVPRLSELPVPLRIVATGLKPGINLQLSDIERNIGRSGSRLSPVRFARRVALFSSVLKRMLAQPHLLEEVVFGSDEGLQDIDAIDALGFSAAVPGLLHYDLGDADTHSAEQLAKLFKDRRLFRLTDGGVVSNVPARAAHRCVERGEIGTRNTFVLALDAFAPTGGSNLPFRPAQHLVRPRVEAQIAFADLYHAYRNPPNPMNVLKTFESLHRTVSNARHGLAAHREFIALMMQRLPPWPRFVAQGMAD